MKKLVNFIVEKRILMLILFNIFAVVSIFLSSKVNINYDISKYLPNDSEVRQGLNIMENEFEETSSSFNLMFKGLKNEQKSEILNELTSIENVKEIAYDETSDFNKDDYTLYIITVNRGVDDKEASKTYKEIINKYKEYNIKTSGDLDSRNKDVLPIYILAAAVICGTIILIIMSDSVMEVFLFLFTILIAVLLNKGTNIIFNNVSNITDSISAILQLALSMDYSIILMNRYRQEQVKNKSKVDAMKDALNKSVNSITSSSITTVVGLLALIFMSFTIGKDLGFVLAKGVICSLISTFFVLPGLILIFDKWIEKTKKKTFSIKFDKLGNLSYKFRYVFLVLFIVLFVGSYFLKGNLGIYYIDNSNDEVALIFPKSNEFAIIYNNKDEEIVRNYVKELEKNESIDSVVSYGNTINDPLPYSLMNKKLKDLGVDTNIEDYLIRLIYYKKNTDETNEMSFNDLILFINNIVYNNQDIEISQEQKDSVSKLSYFINKDSINKLRNINDLSKILSLDKNTLKDLIIYYNSINLNTKISIQNFIKFMKENIINNSNYNVSIDTKQNIEMLYNLMNKLDIKMSSEEISNLFNISKSEVDKVLIYYESNQEIKTKLTINKFSNIVLLNYDMYKEYFDEKLLDNVKTLNKFSDKEFINKKLDSKTLSSIFAIEEIKIQEIFTTLGLDSLSPVEFVNILLTNNIITDDEILNNLKLINGIMQSSNNGVLYTYEELSEFINIDKSNIKLIYATLEYLKNQTTITPRNFVDIIISNNLINNAKIKQLSLIITNLDNKYTSSELSSLLNIDKEQASLIYGLYAYNNGNSNISINKLINFMCKNVINNKNYSSKINSESKQKITGISEVINSSLNDKKHTSKEMLNILEKIDKNIDRNAIEIIYLYYGSNYEYNNDWVMTIEQLIDYLNDDVITDSRFDSYIKDNIKDDIVSSKDKVKEAKELLKGINYSRIIITSKLDIEGKEIENLVIKMKEDLKDTENYIIGDSPMSVEMNNSFNKELELITILTMIFIFVVVAITFKSIIIPIILVLIIQCAVYTTMGILSLFGGNVYFISLLIVQAVLMGATIDYAIVYTTYYLEHKNNFDIKQAIKESYNKSMHTIITSSLILTICTLVVAIFTSAAASRICETISEGTICATILIIFVLPGTLAALNKLIKKK